jgi:TPR repeat protein
MNGKVKESDKKKGFEMIYQAAKMGHPLAAYNMGVFYSSGQYVELDYSQAILWYRKAVESDIEPAIVNLATMYLYGVGVEKDLNIAKEILIKGVLKKDEVSISLFEKYFQ